MSYIVIIPTVAFEKLKQKARKLKRQRNIPHTEALEMVAQGISLPNWHQVTLHAQSTQVTEAAFKSGLIVALDIKDAMEYKFDQDGVFAADDRAHYFCRRDLFEAYKNATDDEGRTLASKYSEEELKEDFIDDLNNYYFYRYAPEKLPDTIDEVYRLCRERCFLLPREIWFKGRYINVLDDLSSDGRMMAW